MTIISVRSAEHAQPDVCGLAEMHSMSASSHGSAPQHCIASTSWILEARVQRSTAAGCHEAQHAQQDNTKELRQVLPESVTAPVKVHGQHPVSKHMCLHNN